jgi:hypothetical protein
MVLLIDDYLRSVIVINFISIKAITLRCRISFLTEWILLIFPMAAWTFNFALTVVLLVRVEVFQVLLVFLAALPSMVCFLVQRVKQVSHKHLVHGVLIVTKVSWEILGVELGGEKTIVKSKFMWELLPIIHVQAWFLGRVVRRALTTTTRLRITGTWSWTSSRFEIWIIFVLNRWLILHSRFSILKLFIRWHDINLILRKLKFDAIVLFFMARVDNLTFRVL